MINNMVDYQHLINYVNNQNDNINENITAITEEIETIKDTIENIEIPDIEIPDIDISGVTTGYYNILEYTYTDDNGAVHEIKNDGTIDCSIALNHFFANHLNEKTNILFPPGVYKITRPLKISTHGSKKVRLRGHGATIKATNNFNDVYTDDKGVTQYNSFVDLNFKFNNDATANKYYDANGINEYNKTFRYILTLYGDKNNANENIYIEGFTFNGSGCASGVNIYYSQMFTLDNCSFINCYKGLELRNDWFGNVHNTTKFYQCKYGIILGGQEINIINFDNITIQQGRLFTSETKNSEIDNKENAIKNSTGVVLGSAVVFNTKFNGLTIEGCHYGIKAIKRYNNDTSNKITMSTFEGIVEFNNCYFEKNTIGSYSLGVNSTLEGLQYIHKNDTNTTTNTTNMGFCRRNWGINIRNNRFFQENTYKDRNIELGIGTINFENCDGGEELVITVEKNNIKSGDTTLATNSNIRTQIISDFALNDSILPYLGLYTTAKINSIGKNRIKYHGLKSGTDQTYPVADLQTLEGALENFYIESGNPINIIRSDKPINVIKKNHIMTEVTPYKQIYCSPNPLVKPILPIFEGYTDLSLIKKYYVIEGFNSQVKQREVGSSYYNQRGYSGQELYNMSKYMKYSNGVWSGPLTLTTTTSQFSYYCNELQCEVYAVGVENESKVYFINTADLNNNEVDIKTLQVIGNTEDLINNSEGLKKNNEFYDVYTNQIIKYDNGVYYIAYDIFGMQVGSTKTPIPYIITEDPWLSLSGFFSDKSYYSRLFFYLQYTEKNETTNEEETKWKYIYISSDVHDSTENNHYTMIDLKDYIVSNFKQ